MSFWPNLFKIRNEFYAPSSSSIFLIFVPEYLYSGPSSCWKSTPRRGTGCSSTNATGKLLSLACHLPFIIRRKGFSSCPLTSLRKKVWSGESQIYPRTRMTRSSTLTKSVRGFFQVFNVVSLLRAFDKHVVNIDFHVLIDLILKTLLTGHW